MAFQNNRDCKRVIQYSSGFTTTENFITLQRLQGRGHQAVRNPIKPRFIRLLSDFVIFFNDFSFNIRGKKELEDFMVFFDNFKFLYPALFGN